MNTFWGEHKYRYSCAGSRCICTQIVYVCTYSAYMYVKLRGQCSGKKLMSSTSNLGVLTVRMRRLIVKRRDKNHFKTTEENEN